MPPVSLDCIIPIGVFHTILCAYLTPLELVIVSRISRSFYAAVQDYIRSVYNAHRLLSPFFHDVPSFRSLQASTGTLISGNSALHFLDRSRRLCDPLDIFVYFLHRREVVEWLEGAGYTLVMNSDDDDSPLSPVIRYFVQTFKKRGTSPGVLVRVVVAAGSPMDAILRSYSTCMINVISYEKAYCLFPRPTLHDHVALILNTKRVFHPQIRRVEIDNIEARGFKVVQGVPLERLVSPYPGSPFALGWRWIDDSETWVVNFDTHDVTLPPPANLASSARTHDPVAVCGFSLRYSFDRRAHIEFDMMDGPPLEFVYFLGDIAVMDQLARKISYKRQPWRQWKERYWDEELRALHQEALEDLITIQRKIFARMGST